ncbi:protein kinase [Gemmatirosa kalamazoonensis]|uniref:Protein kinase n=1 Tax=Gemmatirosa kalamazoonensis TaxID=861299 RepID=W0RE43_9BACT|nr:serine/threonine-protein kinase [Gemmatirosa kalamazoonensis]AHG89364.1 protein kinase [Gemmatirosa kalamazoonensis]
MTQLDRWRRVEQVLDAALAREPAQWPALLDQTCAGDPDLRREVESLLDRLGTARRFLDAPPIGAAAAAMAERRAEAYAAPAQEGRRVGAYRLVREIGRGGMSRVFLAERADGQFDQRVALKLLRPGLDADIDRERFRAERQILATLNHPNVARLLDGGMTDDDQPYLVLEHVDGVPIDRYCAARSLSVAERVRLFLPVVEATQYAHRSLVVHRDLKPSNVLVTDDGTPKLLDFGLAKLLQDGTTPVVGAYAPPSTRAGHRWMTPEYAAPEQIRGEPVTTLTDVYQLGALLYELLAGRLPFGARVGREGGERALEDAILRGDPPPPSAVAATDDARRALRGDLDAIVLKALRREPERRYASAAALLDDLQRLRDGRPVLARPDDAWYRVRKFCVRHRGGVAAAFGIGALATAYVSTVVVGRARIQRALVEATVNAHKAEQVTDFMLGLFEASESGKALGDTVTARALLGRGLARARELSGQPELRAQMLDVIGRVHTQLGDYDEARPLLDEALAIRRRLHGENHVDVANSLEHLADVYENKQELPETIRLRREVLAVRRTLGGERDPKTVDALYDLAVDLHQAGDARTAVPLFDRWLSLIARQPREITPARAARLTGAANLLNYRGDFVRAEPLYRQALAVTRAFYGERHPAVTANLIELGMSLGEHDRHDEAQALLREAVDILRAAHPQGHPDLSVALRNLGVELARAKRYREAEPVLREALQMNRRFLGPDAIDVGVLDVDLASVLTQNDQADEAVALSRDALRVFRSQLGEKSAMVANARVHLGDALRAQGRLAEAEPLLLAGYERFRVDNVITRQWRLYALAALVRFYTAAKRDAEAAKYRALLPPD